MWKYKQLKKKKKDKCIPLWIKDDNVPPKFVVPIENATLKDQTQTKVGYKILNFNNYGTHGNKKDS